MDTEFLILNALIGGSVGVILNQRDDWTPLVDKSITTKQESPEFSVIVKKQWDDDTLDSRQSSQADWIRQYVEQQEEVSANNGTKYVFTRGLKALKLLVKLQIGLTMR